MSTFVRLLEVYLPSQLGYLSVATALTTPFHQQHAAGITKRVIVIHTSSIVLNPACTPLNHLPLSSSSSPIPPSSLRLLASFASSTARIFFAFKMLTSSCSADTCACLCGRLACRASICLSMSASCSSRSLSSSRVGWSARERAGLSDLGP